jgi:guanylate kinase
MTAILHLDVQGALEVMKSRPEALTVFVHPPDFETLGERLRARGREPEDEITRRLETAKWEIAQSPSYRFQIVNDEVERAVTELRDLCSGKVQPSSSQ